MAKSEALAGPKRESIAAFLQATARGYRFAAEEPEAAARVFLAAVKEEYAEGVPLSQPFDEEMVVASHVYTARHFLDASESWGKMEAEKWGAYVDWLDDKGLLTEKVQSRKEPSEQTTSLDGLREGDVGARVPRGSIVVEDLFTNSLL